MILVFHFFFLFFFFQIENLRQTEPTIVSGDLYALANGPDIRINSYSGCIVNGVRFLTEEEDKHRITKHRGVNSVLEHEGEDVDFMVLYAACWS